MKLQPKVKNAIMIGTLCAISYLAVYTARNMLSAVTPQMVEEGYTEAYIGQISSLYFVFYAFGQLINGIVGDKINGKWMMSIGLLGAGVANLVFLFILPFPTAAAAAYALAGFFLSMIYAPMTKIVSENTDPLYVPRCSLGYEFASLFGSPTAGILATFLAWQSVFAVGSVFLFAMSAILLLVFSRFERKKIICYGQYTPQKQSGNGIRVLLQHHIVKFSLIAIVTGVVRTSVVFWLPTYLSQHLHFTPQTSAILFTVSTLIISLAAFISVFLYEKLGRSLHKSLILMFASAAVCFALTYLVSVPILNIVFIILAIMSSNGASTMLWSIYCPSLRDTGRVSSATGFLDFLSYMAAAAANLIFANAVNAIGWGNLILVWLALMIVGVIISLPYHRFSKQNSSVS